MGRSLETFWRYEITRILNGSSLTGYNDSVGINGYSGIERPSSPSHFRINQRCMAGILLTMEKAYVDRPFDNERPLSIGLSRHLINVCLGETAKSRAGFEGTGETTIAATELKTRSMSTLFSLPGICIRERRRTVPLLLLPPEKLSVPPRVCKRAGVLLTRRHERTPAFLMRDFNSSERTRLE